MAPPMYEYLCALCADDVIHTVVKTADLYNSDEPCPKCNTNMDRQVSRGTRAIFKGSGFYQTDYKNQGK